MQANDNGNIVGSFLADMWPLFTTLEDVCSSNFADFNFIRLEIQYKHLLTLWRTRHWNLKQALSKEQVFTQVKVIKSTSPEKVSCYGNWDKLWQ